MTIRTNTRELGAALVAAFCLAGCGTSAQQRATPQPKLPRPLAAALAQRSDAVAQALDAGDTCQAVVLAQELQQQTISAINAGRVQAPLQEPLLARVNDLVERIQCMPPAEDKHDRGKGRGKGKKKHGEEGD